MKNIFLFVFGIFFLIKIQAQNIDTLRIIILSPNKVEFSKNCLPKIDSIRKEITEWKAILKKRETDKINNNLEEYNKLPIDFKQVFENSLNFIDSLTLENYISLFTQGWIDYRLYKPYKISPKLVLLSSLQSNSAIENYKKIATKTNATFIINFPSIKIYKEKDGLKTSTKIELYYIKRNEILLSQENIGSTKAIATDMPICKNGDWTCAFTNSIYPSFYNCLQLIIKNK